MIAVQQENTHRFKKSILHRLNNSSHNESNKHISKMFNLINELSSNDSTLRSVLRNYIENDLRDYVSNIKQQNISENVDGFNDYFSNKFTNINNNIENLDFSTFKNNFLDINVPIIPLLRQMSSYIDNHDINEDDLYSDYHYTIKNTVTGGFGAISGASAIFCYLSIIAIPAGTLIAIGSGGLAICGNSVMKEKINRDKKELILLFNQFKNNLCRALDDIKTCFTTTPNYIDQINLKVQIIKDCLINFIEKRNNVDDKRNRITILENTISTNIEQSNNSRINKTNTLREIALLNEKKKILKQKYI